jgi:hypothetical protein
VRLIRRLAVPVVLTGIGFAMSDGWTAVVFYAAAGVWLLGVGVEAWILPKFGVFGDADPWSRRLLAVEATTLVLWTVWGIVDTVAGPPWLSFLAFGLVSLPIGVLLLVLSLVGLAGASQAGRPKRYGVAAACLSFVIGVVPLATLLTLDGGSMS